MFRKLKSLLLTDQWFYSLLILLVGVVSFLLGHASAVSGVTIGNNVKVETVSTATVSRGVGSALPAKSETNGAPTSVAATAVVASKSGTKYHLPTCPGAKQIKEENKLFFNTTAEAEAAGYKRAANCP